MQSRGRQTYTQSSAIEHDGGKWTEGGQVNAPIGVGVREAPWRKYNLSCLEG